MAGTGQERHQRHFELAATALLAVAAVATAWAAYQSARWHGEQARAGGASIASHVESTREANTANQQTQVDVALFTQWVDAYARRDRALRLLPKALPAGVPARVPGVGRDQAASQSGRPGALLLGNLLWIATFPVSLAV